MKKLFVPYELCLALKEKGFDEPCFAFYNYSFGNLFEPQFHSGFLQNCSNELFNWNDCSKYPLNNQSRCSAPLFQQVKDWIRGKHGIHIEIYCNSVGFGYILTKLNGTTIKEIEDFVFFETNEEAIGKAISESLKLI